MNRVTAHIIRIVGLVIEMIGVWAVFTDKGNTDATRITLPGGTTASVGWLAVGLGFVLWLAGTVLAMFLREPRRRLRRSDEESGGAAGVDLLAPPARTDDRSR